MSRSVQSRFVVSVSVIWGQSADTARSWALIGPLWQWDDDDAQCEAHRGSHEHAWCWSTNMQTQVKVKQRVGHVINAESAADRRRRNWEDNAPSLVHTWETASAVTLSFLFHIHGEGRADGSLLFIISSFITSDWLTVQWMRFCNVLLSVDRQTQTELWTLSPNCTCRSSGVQQRTCRCSLDTKVCPWCAWTHLCSAFSTVNKLSNSGLRRLFSSPHQ